ncbi:MAG TPA: maleylpyruvate isomerase family mycothiol-dependent enzyme [Acidimicrobiales bacterium]
MDRVLAALAAQHGDLEAIVSSLDESGWAAPSRCAGWTVADVVLHLAQTDEMAIASLEGRLAGLVAASSAPVPPAADVDEAAAAMVASEQGAAPADLLDRWRSAAQALRRELAARQPGVRVTWVAGELSVHTLATTRLAEAWIHTGDVAAPFGREVAADDRLWHIARLAWRTLPYAFARAGRELSGPVAFRLASPGGDTWHFEPDEPPVTTITGPAFDLCRVAGQRAGAAETALRGDGPDAAAVLDLVRTFA